MIRRRSVLGALAASLLPAAVLGQQAESYRLTLGDAARLAAERGTPVMEARARVDQAEARYRSTRADLLPSLDADVSRGARTFNTASFGLDFPTLPGQDPFFDPEGEVVGPVKSTDLRARASMPLLDLAAFGRRKSARAGADAAQQEEAVAADAAAAGAARAYVATLRARAEVAAREEDIDLAQELVDVAQGLLDAGVGVAIDLTRAQSQMATIRAQLISSRHRAEVAELTLRRTLHLSDDAALELTDDLESLQVELPPGESDAIDAALAGRSDLGMAQAYQTAAQEAISATRAGRLPRISANLDEGYYGKKVFEHLLRTYSWSVRLSVPLFDGFERSSRIDEQEARAREIGYRIEDLEEEVAFEVRQALLGLAAAQEQAAAAEERLRLAELEVSQEEDRLQAGVAGTADVVMAAMRLNQARTARLDALSAVQTSRVALAAAMGTVVELP